MFPNLLLRSLLLFKFYLYIQFEDFAEPDASDISISTKILKYGSYYVVHDAQYEGKQCITKLEHSKTVNSKKLLKQERKVLVTLNHSCIIQLLDKQCNPKSPELFMEKLWISLTDSLASKKIHYDKITILQDVANGLSYIHEKGIIHCNLTGNSILLTDKGRAKISDFGRAFFYQSSFVSSSPVIVENLDYMPPEVLIPIPIYSTKLDTFSFGCVIIYTVTQEPPMPDCDRFVKTSEVGKYKIYSEIDRRSVVLKKLKKDCRGMKLHDIVLKCLQDNPDNRPTAEALYLLLKKQIINATNNFLRYGKYF